MTGELSYEDILDRIRCGDDSKTADLFSMFRTRLRRMIQVRLDDRVLARVDPSDVVQETLMLASSQFADYVHNPPLPFYPWLRQLALNRLAALHREHIHTEKRRVGREVSMGISNSSAMQLGDQFATSDSPLTGMIREELHARVQLAMGELPAVDREILILRHLEDLNYAESAQVMGITETVARQRHVRAVRRINRLLGASS